eukprot:6559228-Lingulodinium_polyedra.AAC.1
MQDTCMALVANSLKDKKTLGDVLALLKHFMPHVVPAFENIKTLHANQYQLRLDLAFNIARARANLSTPM